MVSLGLPADFPALRTLDGRAHNLPIQATPLIGREPELAAARALPAQPRCSAAHPDRTRWKRKDTTRPADCGQRH